jgi:hypothetical protein
MNNLIDTQNTVKTVTNTHNKYPTQNSHKHKQHNKYPTQNSHQHTQHNKYPTQNSHQHTQHNKYPTQNSHQHNNTTNILHKSHKHTTTQQISYTKLYKTIKHISHPELWLNEEVSSHLHPVH